MNDHAHLREQPIVRCVVDAEYRTGQGTTSQTSPTGMQNGALLGLFQDRQNYFRCPFRIFHRHATEAEEDGRTAGIDELCQILWWLPLPVFREPIACDMNMFLPIQRTRNYML